jgi:hypothetical protein
MTLDMLEGAFEGIMNVSGKFLETAQMQAQAGAPGRGVKPMLPRMTRAVGKIGYVHESGAQSTVEYDGALLAQGGKCIAVQSCTR